MIPRWSGAVRDAELDTVARAFAERGAQEAEEMIAALAADAIRLWRLDEATFWQRVRFKARFLRAARDGGGSPVGRTGVE